MLKRICDSCRKEIQPGEHGAVAFSVPIEHGAIHVRFEGTPGEEIPDVCRPCVRALVAKSGEESQVLDIRSAKH